MKDSKSKGMNWAGNIYHKFEGIIPEVNDVRIQDTFKYVGSHVHTVGGTFKKFCSDVVQDFLPLSVDPVKCEDKAVVPEGDAAISSSTYNNSVISTVEISSDAVVKKSLVVIDAIDYAEKQLGHVSGHHNAFQPEIAKSTATHETSDSATAARDINDMTNADSGLSNDLNTIKESPDGPVQLTFPAVAESSEASSLNKFIETNQDNECVVSTVDPVDHAEKQLDHVSTEQCDQFKIAKSTNDHETSGSVLVPVLTNANSDLSNDINSPKESAYGPLELTTPGVAESSEASSLDELTEINHENECVVSAKVAPATSVENLEIEHSTGALCDIFADDTECYFGASSIPYETVFSVVPGEDTITGAGLVSSTSSRLRDSTSLPGYSSDILFPGAMFCHNPGDLVGCVSDGPTGLLSSTPASVMLTKDKALDKQLVSSSSLLPLESTDGSTDGPDTGMETIDLCDETKLGDSCVFVDDTVLHAVSRRARKHESYKKKIRDIFASKKRLEKEYEQLAIWYGDTDIDFSQDSLFDSQNLQTRHACDSEWELL